MIPVILGSVVAIKCGRGEHWGFVAGDYGRLTIISNRGLKDGVTEEPWEDVVGTAAWRIVDSLATAFPAYLVVARARSMIGTRYNFWAWNCEDLVFWALGLQPKSPQRDGVVGLLGVACLVMFVGITGKRG
jgi:hypothetical protein